MSLIPSVRAQTASSRQPLVSILAEPLSRQSLGPIKNVDGTGASLAHSAVDGHLVITGVNTEVVVAPDQYIELVPKTEVAGFTPIALIIFEDGKRQQSFPMEKGSGVPFIRIDPPAGQINRKRIQAALYDANNHVRTMQQCILRAHVPTAPPSLSVKTGSDICALTVADRAGLGLVELSLNGVSLGRLDGSQSAALVDARRLAPGPYTFEVFAQTPDGVIMPPVKTEFTVAPRYTLALNHDASPVQVNGQPEADRLTLTVTHAPNVPIAKTCVYIGGEYVGVRSGATFILDIPLVDVPTGKTTIDVIGVGQDGTRYYVESLPLEVQNALWEEKIYPTPTYGLLKEKLAEAAANKVQFEYWYEKFAHEPFTRFVGTQYLGLALARNPWTGNNYLYEAFQDRYAPTDALAFKRNADKCFQAMTKCHLEAGRLYAILKMKQDAKRMFRTVLQEVGDKSNLGAAAKADMEALTPPLQ